MRQVLAECSASISELKKNPSALISKAAGAPVAILNHNVPAAYLIPADTYEWIMDAFDDYVLSQLVEQRMGEKSEAIDVSLDEL